MLTFARKIADRDPVRDAMRGTDVGIDFVPVVFVFRVFIRFVFAVGPPKRGGRLLFLGADLCTYYVRVHEQPSALISTTDPQFLSPIFESPAPMKSIPRERPTGFCPSFSGGHT